VSAIGMRVGRTKARRIATALLLAAVAALCLWVLRPFLSSLAWATILAYVTWPTYQRLRRRWVRSDSGAALAMTALVSCALFVPLAWLVLLVRSELASSYRSILAASGAWVQAIPAQIHRLPWLGGVLAAQLNRYMSDPSAIARELSGWLQSGMSLLGTLLGGLGQRLVQVLLTILILFFLYRDGATPAREISRATLRLFGGAAARYARAAGAITRAVFFGVILAAIAQGVIAGIGYWVVGIKAPVLLGALTGALSIVPLFGTALVWVPAGIGLMLAGHLWSGLLLLAWGALLVHPADNLLHAFLVSSATRLPLLLIALGLIGGLAAFGLVGLFVGPLLLGTAFEAWRQWTKEENASAARHSSSPAP
jgi:predicted PurR-regulated permease PerM